ncbi:MAG: hypothetical protein RL172_258 [Bacteroidota bacterium]
MKKIVTQPLFHFLLLGAILFVLYQWVNPGTANKDAIVIDDEIVTRNISLFEKEWGRKPTEAELKGTIERVIKQEVFYRQALKMNLDHNDEIIKRRMEQKLSFITTDLATMKEPTEPDLKNYYEQHKAKYQLPATLSFSHIYFNPDKRKDALKDAETVLAQLQPQDLNDEALRIKGDAFPFLQKINNLSQKEIATQMGDAFADTITRLKPGKWHGPVLSGYGTHLVFISTLQMAILPEWQKVRADVLRDYQYHLSEKINEDVYQNFKKEYDIRFELKDAALQKIGLAN